MVYALYIWRYYFIEIHFVHCMLNTVSHKYNCTIYQDGSDHRILFGSSIIRYSFSDAINNSEFPVVSGASQITFCYKILDFQ